MFKSTTLAVIASITLALAGCSTQSEISSERGSQDNTLRNVGIGVAVFSVLAILGTQKFFNDLEG